MLSTLDDFIEARIPKINISTSYEAYLDTKDQHDLQRTQVLKCIKNHTDPISDMQIHDETGVPIHLVPARRNELIDEGLVCYTCDVEYKNRRRKGWK